MKRLYEQIARELELKYSYYSTVYFGFIVEAVENTIHDHRGKILPLDEIHQYIIENFI